MWDAVRCGTMVHAGGRGAGNVVRTDNERDTDIVDLTAPDPIEGDDITKARGDAFLDRLEQLLQTRGAATTRLAKESFSRPASAGVIERVALHGDLAVEALAD